MLLREHPALRMELFGILSEEFVGKSEFYEYMKKSDERFESLLQELRAFRADTNRRFEEVNRRFEAVDKRFDKVDSNIENLKDWVGTVVGGFQRRAGKSLEDVVAGTLRIALGKDVKPENIILRKKIKDDDGMIGRPGRKYEIDICVTNEEYMVFEIKSYAKPDEIDNFNEKAELVKKKLGRKEVVKVLITLEKHPSVVKQCEKLGILVG